MVHMEHSVNVYHARYSDPWCCEHAAHVLRITIPTVVMLGMCMDTDHDSNRVGLCTLWRPYVHPTYTSSLTCCIVSWCCHLVSDLMYTSYWTCHERTGDLTSMVQHW